MVSQRVDWIHTSCIPKVSQATLMLVVQSMLILEATELLNIARKMLSDKQPPVDEQPSVFEEIASVIISPALNSKKLSRWAPMR